MNSLLECLNLEHARLYMIIGKLIADLLYRIPALHDATRRAFIQFVKVGPGMWPAGDPSR